ncbi:hypothetical protein [Pseudomonas aeruginosa]|uniref:hypothetical protein n=1 Tax=Pseudomonas aeruginosa TaxID=287 RepID=UPI000EB5E660|nr:hypothetical protein [Pseudomonas aeruginosa]
MTTPSSPAPSANESKRDKVLRNTHFVVSAVILGVAGQVWINGDGNYALSFMLAALSLLLTSFGALNLSGLTDNARKGVIILSLVVAGLGAFAFIEGMREADEHGPRIYDVRYEFTAAKFKVEGISDTPCVQESDDSPVTCTLVVTPLSDEQAVGDQEQAAANDAEPKE